MDSRSKWIKISFYGDILTLGKGENDILIGQELSEGLELGLLLSDLCLLGTFLFG